MPKFSRRVTTAVSGKTSYLVAGDEPGESKINKAKKCGTKIVDEDGFLALIGSSESKPDTQTEAARKAAKTMDDAMDIDSAPVVASKPKATAIKREPSVSKPAMATLVPPPAEAPLPTAEASHELWTEKYRPRSIKDIVGNKGQVQKLSDWLSRWYII